MVTKFDIDKFDGKISFTIWKVHMQAVLTHHGYKKALRGIAHKPQSMSDEDWLELDEKALATIQLFLTREFLREVIHETTAAGTSVQDYLDEFNTILIDIENLDVDIDDEDKAVLLDDNVEPESGEGLVARGRSSDRSKCNNEKIPEKAVEVAIAKGDSDGDVYLAIDTEKSRDELIVDSGCTFHMIPHRSWFTTYESFNGVNVYMRNHSICPIIGKGNIQVKMHDGVVRTITRVRHVPYLKRNLISLSTLEANGCKYSGDDGVMKIFKGPLVLLKAIQSGGLYVLRGTVVYSTVGVATSKVSLDDSKLWHYRLGHMGEKGMKNLAKKGFIKVSCNLKFYEHSVFSKQKRIKKLRTDNGLGFCGDSFNALFQNYGIARHHTLVRTLQQNGVAERMNKTIMEKVRCMLSHSNLDKDFWVEATTTIAYLINPSPHRSLDGNIPEILWSGNSVDYYNLRIFGCPIYVHVNKGKLVPRAVKCIFLGYGSAVKGYRVWCPDLKYRKIIHSRDVTFNEDVINNSGKDFVPPHNVDNNHTEGKVEFEFDVENSTHTQPPFNDEHIETQEDGNMPTSPQSQPQTEYLLARDRKSDKSIDLQDLRIINVKDGIPGVESNRYKARYVVRGFDQCEGVDFNEVFSLIVRHTSIRVLLSTVDLQVLELEQLNVKTAFLHGHLEEEIYVEQPEDGSFLYLILYVDDMLIVAPNKDQIRELKDQLSKEFDMKDFGAAKRILGMEIQRDQKMSKLTLSQTDYISKVLKKFNMSSYKPIPTPLAPHFKLSSRECLNSEEDKEDMSRVLYSSAVGNLMYAMVCTRLDLAYAVSVVSRYMHNPSEMHWEAVKCILRYLKGTNNIGLSFEKGRASPNGVVGYVDSDYAGDLDARKSLSSYIFSHCSFAISWYSSLQAITALSTTEAEYISSAKGVKEAIWLRGMDNEFGLPQEVLVVYCDNRSVMF
nr:hypothetical protein [Tanacetum cinerariifolium]